MKMDRMQPPPNYYGQPYGPDMGQPPYPPQGGYPPQLQPGEQPMAPSPTCSGPNGPNTGCGQGNFQKNPTYFSDLCSINIGKACTVYCSFGDSATWHDMKFAGILSSASDDHVVIYDKTSGKCTLIIGVYIDYIEFGDNMILK